MKHLLLILVLLFVFGCDTGTNNNKLNYNHLVWVVVTLDSVKYPLYTDLHQEWFVGSPDTLIFNTAKNNYNKSYLVPQNARLYSQVVYVWTTEAIIRCDTLKASSSADTMYWDIK